MAASLKCIEVCEGLRRHTSPEMTSSTELHQLKATYENSQAGLFASIFSYPTPDTAGISTINSAATVINQPKYGLKMNPKCKMARKFSVFSGNRTAPYICYKHKGGN